MPASPDVGEPLRTLAGVASYRCEHSGSCCRAGWPIPIEAEPLRILRRAGWAAEDADAVLGRTADGRCAFHEPSRSGGCRVERTLGVGALPSSCRQFPRLLLADARGWHLSLSAWCGTVARLIVERAPGGATAGTFLDIAHVSADARVHLECLDARDAWPPFLRPGVLAGLGAYERWESRLLRDGLAPVVTGTRHLGESLNHVGRWTEALAHWKASDGDLAVLIDRVPWPANRIPQTAPSTEALDVVVDELMAQVPAEWRVSAWPDGLPDATMDGAPITQVEAEAALARYLALRLIGSWVSYQGAGLRSVVASLISADALATAALVRTAAAGPVTTGHVMSAIRAADWLQLHLLDREPWAAWCRAAESTVGLTRLLSVVSAAHHARAALAWAPAAH